MSSKTKIIVLHMKEIIYTAIFIVLAILLVILFTIMFRPEKAEHTSSTEIYNPGIYTSTVMVNNHNLEIEVAVDSSHINAIRFNNLDEAIATMNPLLTPAMESIADQICTLQSLENIQFSEESPYTSQVILNAIKTALDKAKK